MNLKEEYQELVKKLKEVAAEGGVKLRNADIAQKLGYNPDYFSSLNGKSGSVTQDHINQFKNVFGDQLAGKPILIAPPGAPLNPQTALMLAILEDYAEWKAEMTHQTFESVKDGIKKRGRRILGGLDSWLPQQ
ncbi:hypothetical protein EGT74_24305 [Chitinophaga lutea]|uniref:Uncharacterized protein n=1 Tax=Chitinophaga lutea TaxID=2488634 RepID=A0A3N4PP55_9BACT|nr:hypothetical protein [Chitinophaga lutea]RPE05510.1 hypothetical protein EGT74_24305 [Chitinophaga lutea]